MTPFTTQEISPAAKEALEAQASLMNDVSQRMFSGLQKMGELNLQFAQSLMQATIQGTQGVLKTTSTTEATAAAASQLKPITETTQRYAQGLQEIATNLQLDLQSVAEQHLPQTKRATSELASEIQQRGQDQAQKVQQAFSSTANAVAQGAQAGSTASSPSATTKGAASPTADAIKSHS